VTVATMYSGWMPCFMGSSNGRDRRDGSVGSGVRRCGGAAAQGR
jgi:hypothetical protein